MRARRPWRRRARAARRWPSPSASPRAAASSRSSAASPSPASSRSPVIAPRLPPSPPACLPLCSFAVAASIRLRCCARGFGLVTLHVASSALISQLGEASSFRQQMFGAEFVSFYLIPTNATIARIRHARVAIWGAWIELRAVAGFGLTWFASLEL